MRNAAGMKALLLLFLFPYCSSKANTIKVPANSSVQQVNSIIAGAAAGDIIAFERGGQWTGHITVSAKSGTPAQPIVLTNYGTGPLPIFNTREQIPGAGQRENWKNEGQNKWSLPLISPQNVDYRIWLNDKEHPRGYGPDITPQRPVSYDTDWNKVYVYSAKNPAEAFKKIEYASTSTSTILITDSKHIVVNGLDIRGSIGGSLDLSNASFITITGCKIGWDANRIGIRAGTSGKCTDITITDNEIDSGDRLQDIYRLSHGVADGIFMAGGCHRWTIKNNIIRNWGHACVEISNVYNGSDKSMSDILIEGNYITAPDVDYCRAFGIDSREGRPVSNVKILYNWAENLTIQSQLNLPGVEFAHNIIANIRKTSNPGFAADNNANGLFIAGYSRTSPTNMKFYNNTIANCDGVGLFIKADTSYGRVANNEFINNIFFNNGKKADWGFDNLQIVVAPNDSLPGMRTAIGPLVFRNNVLFSNATTNVLWDGRLKANPKMTLPAFNNNRVSAADVIRENLFTEPGFTDPERGNFSLQKMSPAISAGFATHAAQRKEQVSAKSTESKPLPKAQNGSNIGADYAKIITNSAIMKGRKQAQL